MFLPLRTRGHASKSSRAGFTLIELLVVIAIIGILSSVILASLSTARNKGVDSNVQANLHNIHTAAESFASSNGGTGYGTSSGSNACTLGMFGDAAVVAIITSAKGAAKGGTIYCNSVPTAYAVQALVNGTSTATTYWCTDSTGVSRYDFAPLSSSATTCP